jgi:hypothetical protein
MSLTISALFVGVRVAKASETSTGELEEEGSESWGGWAESMAASKTCKRGKKFIGLHLATQSVE